MPIRETFWNIPYWVEITQYILGFLAIGIFTYGMIRHVNRWRKGKGKLQTNKFGYRLMAVLKHGIGQFR
jgi:hypothetical protein